ncbi:deaminase, partial [Propionibacterium freudenreichii]|uniref:deaminase n=1 Tax=Propionibacterium freudenreichii TaxID=1744 RepID=UPI003853D659
FKDTLVTNPEVSHAEENAIAKLAKSNVSSQGATAYVTLEPCMHCAKLLYSAGINRVVVKEPYTSHEGTMYLVKLGIT